MGRGGERKLFLGFEERTTGILRCLRFFFPPLLRRQEARDVIRNAVHASEDDAVIFAGNGCTGALHKLIHALDLEEAPIVFVGSNEHHSILLPWREIGAKVSLAFRVKMLF